MMIDGMQLGTSVFIKWGLPLPMLALLAGCGCGTVDCDACIPEGFALRFDADSLNNGFRWADLRSTYVVRYALNNYQQPLDTAQLRSGYGYRDIRATFVLSFNGLFPPRAGEYLPVETHSYRIVIPAAQRQYDVTNIALSYKEGTGCCACDQLIRSRFHLNNVPVEVTPPASGGAVLRR
ncbi:hypothetical protein MTX78_03585 [Hymenobacter tibetensis]|uniref:Lipoprotein n=1 Tax=Hymenobacter tibetensis TaxID=497967 RepID=A0ABY4CZI5_9BACT|nr:hypothetical protein [Hymenobacter tibetensis]UOG75681.1 hypothetical protein MTX78_03585 [Hymenobacter tibetensis]